MGNKNTHDKLLNPTPTNDKTRHQKESRDSDVLQEGKKKNKRNRSPHKDKKKYKRTNHKKKTAVVMMMMMMMSLHLQCG
jgi:hypothetical protein